MKVERCPKSSRILGVILPSHILLGNPFQNLYPRYNDCLVARCLVKLRELTPTTPKVIGVNTLNFKPNFTCSTLKFWGTPNRFVVCTGKPW